MKLGTYVEIRTVVDDLIAGLAFYEKLGFEAVGDTTLTDGCINLRLLTGSGPTPVLAYAGSDLDALRRAGLSLTPTSGGAMLEAPGGLQIALSPAPSLIAMPAGPPLARTPHSQLGTFGELALSVADFEQARAFWEQAGFETMHAAISPYPWGIVTDDLIVVGLHQNQEFGMPGQRDVLTRPTLTYFAGDMAQRIAALQADGVALDALPPVFDGQPVVNACCLAPGGQQIFLFKGEVA